MLAFGNVAAVLGLPSKVPPSLFELITSIEGGLPVAALDRVAKLLAPGDAQFKYKFIPKATYDRRKIKQRLSSEESARLARVARVWSLAFDVWKTEADVRDFLFRPHPMLEDKQPIHLVIQNEFGAEMVMDILGRLKYGTAA